MKKIKLFNQSFGTVDSPNQTGETLTRENRIGLKSYLSRTLMLLFAVLVMSIANIGMAWGAGTAIADLNFNAPTSLPSNYTYSTTNSPDIQTFQSVSCVRNGSGASAAPDTWSATNAAAPSGGKRWLAFQPAVDCRVTLKVGKENDSRTFYLMDKDHSTHSSPLSSYNPSAKNVWEETWSVSLTGGTWYAITGSSSKCYIASMQFVANPTFSESAGAELAQNEGTVTLTASGTTIYYKWSTSSSAYNADAGSSLVSAADGNGTSPKTVTAPDGTGTYYLYAVAKRGNYYSDVVKRSYTITATPSRTFKSGEKIYFKDQTCSSTLSGAVWDASGGDVYAYFWNDTENAWSTYGDKVSGTWHEADAIYKIVVPGSGKEYTKVLFTRGTAASWDGRWDGAQTNDQFPDVGKNMFIISDSKTDGKWDGTWDKYAPNPVILGDFNDWDPDQGTLDGSNRLIVDLEASTNYEFKVLVGDGSVLANWYGLNSGNITNTTSSWWLFYSKQDNCTVTSGEAGEYCFHWDNSSKYIGVYYPQARLEKDKYIYFDARDNSTWTASNFDARFWFKYYDSDSNYPDDLTDYTCTKANAKDSWVYPYVVPNSDYIGQVQLNRYVSGSWNADADKIAAHTRTSSKQNCIKLASGSGATSWTTYCPPMSSASLSDNSTTVIAGTSGNGTSGNPYLVPTSGTIEVTAAATSAVPDANMTKMFDFKVNGSSQQNSTTTTYSKGSLSNNTTYTITVDAYNTYNETNGTKSTPAALYYKALNTYAIKYYKGTGDGITGSHDDDLKIYGIDKSLPGAVFTRPNYKQTGWATSDGGSQAYALSTSYTGNAALNLYPVWTAKTTPTAYEVSGSVSGVCTGATATITLADSEEGVSYQLYKGGVAQGDPKAGTGDELSWTGQTAGTYTIVTVETTDYQGGVSMSNSVTVTALTTTAISTQPTTAVAAGAGVNFTLGENLDAEGENLEYQWYSYTSSGGAGEAPISGANEATYTTSKSAGT